MTTLYIYLTILAILTSILITLGIIYLIRKRKKGKKINDRNDKQNIW